LLLRYLSTVLMWFCLVVVHGTPTNDSVYLSKNTPALGHWLLMASSVKGGFYRLKFRTTRRELTGY
jgi:hypothetical protein